MQILGITRRQYQRIERIHRLGQVEIAMVEDIAVVIGKQHRNGRIAFDDTQQEVNVYHRRGRDAVLVLSRHLFGGAELIDNLLGGIGPNLHTLPLLHGKVLDQIIGHIQEQRHDNGGRQQECDLTVAPYIVYIGQTFHRQLLQQ